MRRCFSGGGLHLNTWEDGSGYLMRFRLSYPDENRRFALLWDRDSGFEHFAVDDGEASGAFHKSSPQLTHAPHRDLADLASTFSCLLGSSRSRKPAATAVLRLIEAARTGPSPTFPKNT